MKKVNVVLPKSEGGKETTNSLVEKVLKTVAVALVVIILLVALIIVSSIGMFNWLALEVRALTGLDVFLAKGIAFVLLALFFGTPLGGFAWSLLPIPQKNKKRKRLIFLSILAVLCFVSYFTSKNVYFNVENGKPLKYFSIGVNGEYNFSNSDGYDPVTGDKLKQVDKATVIQYLKGGKYSENVDYNANYRKILTGLEKDSRFYSILFKNKTEKNLYLCISFKADINGPIIIQRITAGENIRLNLLEGEHFFSYMDSNGKCYGDRGMAMLFEHKILTKSENSLNVSVNNQMYYLEKTFSLNILASDNQIVTLKENNILHNKEMSRGAETFIFILVFFVCMVGVVFLKANE